MTTKMTAGAILTKGATDEWGTPDDLFNALDEELGPFVLDACALDSDFAKCADFISPERDALKTPWQPRYRKRGPVWVNPPYSLACAFMQRAVEQSRALGVRVVCLIPCRTDTDTWHDWVFPFASEVRFIKRRIRYIDGRTGEQGGSSGFPSCVVIFDPLVSRVTPRFKTADQTGQIIYQQPSISRWSE
jgi:site-specific DNA-methyltransferase (adenine-specific)